MDRSARPSRRTGLLGVLLLLIVSGCGTESPASPATGPPGVEPSPSEVTAPTTSPTPPRPDLSGRPIIAGVAPPWLGQRPLPEDDNGFGAVRPTPRELVQRRFTLPDRLPALPGDGFAARVSTPAPAAVIGRSTWQSSCPVTAKDLSWVRLTFWGFDDRRHTGELLVNTAVAEPLVGVFRKLYAARFPIEEMRITTPAELVAAPTGDGNNTAAFTCRLARQSTAYSQHAYGLAVDVNPFQNPYHRGEVVLPELASAYLDRTWRRPGMVSADGPVVRAFADIGWTWGGTWQSLKDLQHFSRNGR